MRERLSPGTNITLHCDGAPRQFQIDAVIGDGASCIAYDAHRTDGKGASLRYRLKECYPFHAQIERSGVRLQWADEHEKQDAFQRLERSHRLVVKLCNDESVGNNITRAELCEGNGTLYSVMDVNHAKTYAFDSNQNLHSILDTMRVLTEVVGNLHAQGYLHLDIKPDNFLVSHRPSTNVWLFDVDSLTSMDDLKSGAVQTISYSQQWAAPEQLLGQTGKLCEATDLFAIGAVLFEKVMGRQVQNEDMGLFADWAFDGAMFENVNPKVKRNLREIFRKTLAASVKRRYSCADELLKTLENACDITIEGKPFLKSDCPVLTTQFVGRQQELLEIRDAFHSGKHAVFLHGVGGIGKSTLALAYGNQFQKEYDAVIFCRYRDSLEELFEDIEIQNFDGSTKDHSKHLRRLLDKNILLIIDNFDVEIDADNFLDDLMRLKCNILFTSRTDFSTVYTGDVKQIEVNSLPYEKLEELFISICGLKLESEEERQTFHKLLKMVDGHTYFIELAAKQIVASGCSLDSLYTALRNGISGLDGKEKVRTQKDGRISKRTIPEILRVLFRIADLNQGQKQILCNLYVLRFIRTDIETYRRFLGATAAEIDSLNDLAELGWIQRSGRLYFLHSLICELCRDDLRPAFENIQWFWSFCQNIGDSNFVAKYSSIDERDWSGSLESEKLSADIQDMLKMFEAIMPVINDSQITFIVKTLGQLIQYNVWAVINMNIWADNLLELITLSDYAASLKPREFVEIQLLRNVILLARIEKIIGQDINPYQNYDEQVEAKDAEIERIVDNLCSLFEDVESFARDKMTNTEQQWVLLNLCILSMRFLAESNQYWGMSSRRNAAVIKHGMKIEAIIQNLQIPISIYDEIQSLYNQFIDLYRSNPSQELLDVFDGLSYSDDIFMKNMEYLEQKYDDMLLWEDDTEDILKKVFAEDNIPNCDIYYYLYEIIKKLGFDALGFQYDDSEAVSLCRNIENQKVAKIIFQKLVDAIMQDESNLPDFADDIWAEGVLLYCSVGDECEAMRFEKLCVQNGMDRDYACLVKRCRLLGYPQIAEKILRDRIEILTSEISDKMESPHEIFELFGEIFSCAEAIPDDDIIDWCEKKRREILYDVKFPY